MGCVTNGSYERVADSVLIGFNWVSSLRSKYSLFSSLPPSSGTHSVLFFLSLLHHSLKDKMTLDNG